MARVRGFGLADGLMARTAAGWVCALGLAAGIAVPLPAQDGKTPTLHVYTNLVQIPTLVIDQDGEPMAPIAEGRFFVSVDGGPKFRVTHVRPEGDDPISLAVVLDVSQPFPTLMPKFDEALAGLAPVSLHTRDRVSVYSLDCHLIRSVNNAPMDSATLKRGVDVALEQWKTRGRDRWTSGCTQPSNLWDALALVSQALYAQPGRRVILVVTDGEDRGSKTSWKEMRQLAQARGEAIFGLVQTGNISLRADIEDIFNSVCELTGGIVMTANDKSLADQLKQFTVLLRGRYIVEFPHPVDTVGGEHGMNITIDKSDAITLPTGIGIPVDDPAILKDPTTVPPDPSGAPQMGKRRSLTPQ